MVYIFIRDGKAIMHTNLDAARQLDGFSKDDIVKKLTDEEFHNLGGQVRFIDNQLVFGETEKEKKAKAAMQEIVQLKAQLAETDYISVKISEGAATKNEYKKELELRAQWRARINELEKYL